jgi:hypothetical protein
MWPVGRANPANPQKHNDSSVNGTTEQQNTNDSSIIDLLDRVHDHLLGDENYEHNRLFSATEKATRQDLTSKFVEGEKPANQEQPLPGNQPSYAQQETSQTTESSGTAEASSPQVNTENLHQNQQQPTEDESLKTLKPFVSIATELLDAFLPANHPSPVADKYYGAMKKIIEVNKELKRTDKRY